MDPEIARIFRESTAVSTIKGNSHNLLKVSFFLETVQYLSNFLELAPTQCFHIQVRPIYFNYSFEFLNEINILSFVHFYLHFIVCFLFLL